MSSFYNDDGLLVKRNYFEGSDKILLERTYKRDSIPHGYGKSFYPSGQIELFIEYFEGLKEGDEIKYFENGKIEKMGVNRKGKADSIWVSYDSLGFLKNVNTWYKGNFTGEQATFYPNGKIREYLFYSPNGQIIYRGSFNNEGNVIFQEGNPTPLIIVITDHDVNEWNIKEELELVVFGSKYLPDADFNGLILRSLNSEKVVDEIIFEQSVSQFRYKHILLETGLFEFKVVGSYQGKDLSASIKLTVVDRYESK